MNKNAKYILFMIILLVSALYLLRKPAGNTENIDRNIFRVDTLKIVSVTYEKDGRKVIVNKGVGNWFIEGEKNYPADISIVNILLKFADEITVNNVISNKTDKFSKFGVDSSAVILTFRLQDNSLKSFLIGKDDKERRHSFYRETDGEQVFLGTLFPRYRLTSDEAQWRDKIITSEEVDAITKVSIMKNNESLELNKEENIWNALLNGKPIETDNDKIKELVNKISMFKAQGFIDNYDPGSQNNEITVLFTSRSGTYEIIVSEFNGSYAAYSREKIQGYRISKTDYLIFSDILN